LKRLIITILCFAACTMSKHPTADEIIEKSIRAHGWDKNEINLAFEFRDFRYELIRKPNFYSYKRTTKKEGIVIQDIMTSKSKLKRYINDTAFKINDSLANIYSNSLNSVMYFFQLPRPLKDPAVVSDFLGEKIILDKAYWTVRIKFKEKDGGKDFQDEYRYWINTVNGQIDYLAYNFLTDGGGTRFRKAKNVIEKDGFVFQDYTNFKPKKKFISLDSLPLLYEQDKLIVVSEIENLNIKVLK